MGRTTRLDHLFRYSATLQRFPIQTSRITNMTIQRTFRMILIFQFNFPRQTNQNSFNSRFTQPRPQYLSINCNIFNSLFLLFTRMRRHKAMTNTRIVTLTVNNNQIISLRRRLRGLTVTSLLKVRRSFSHFNIIAIVTVNHVQRFTT